MATRRSTPELRREPADRLMLLGCGIAELEHVAQHSPGVPASRRPSQPSRVDSAARIDSGIGVVGIVDHRYAVRNGHEAPSANATRTRGGLRAGTRSGRDSGPRASAAAAAATAFATWCRPVSRSRTSASLVRFADSLMEGEGQSAP